MLKRSAKENYDRASELDRAGREEEALNFYLAAFSGIETLSEDDQKGLYLGLGSTYRWNQLPEKSAAVLEEASQKFPGALEFKIFLALAQLDLNQPQLAVANLIETILEGTRQPSILQYQRALRQQVSTLRLKP